MSQRAVILWLISLLIIFFTTYLFFFSASQLPRNWSVSAADKFVLYPIFHDKHVMLSGKCQETDCLKAYNLSNGDIVWEWIDTMGILSKSYYNLKPYIFKNKLVLPLRNFLLALDMTDGKSLWIDHYKWNGASFLEGKDDSVFRSYSNSEKDSVRILKFNLINGNHEVVKTINSENEEKLFIRTPVTLPNSINECAVSVMKYIPNKRTINKLLFLNYDTGTEYASIDIYPDNREGHGITKQGLVFSNRSFWVANNKLVCVDNRDRNIVWQTSFPRDMLTSRLLIDDPYLYYACEDEVLYALDIHSGKIKWQQNLAGTPGRISINDKYLYIVGGSDGRLYVIDKIRGELVMSYSSKQLGLGTKAPDAGLTRVLGVNDDSMVLYHQNKWYIFRILANGFLKI